MSLLDRAEELKERVSRTHLSNDGAAMVCGEVYRQSTRKLKHIILAHLSSQCNEPLLAIQTARRALVSLLGKENRKINIVAGKKSEVTELFTL